MVQKTLANNGFQPAVTLEIRVGLFQGCDQNPQRPNVTVPFGNSVAI